MKIYVIWFVAAFLLIILEPLMPGLVIIWFGLGALFAGILALLGAGFYVQLITFALVSVLSLIFVRKWVSKEEEKPQGVGAERLIGMKGKVISKIPAGDFGVVLVDGEKWRALCNEECGEGEQVLVEKIEGAHLLVKKIKE